MDITGSKMKKEQVGNGPGVEPVDGNELGILVALDCQMGLSTKAGQLVSHLFPLMD